MKQQNFLEKDILKIGESLRKEGLTYQEICNQFKKMGIKNSYGRNYTAGGINTILIKSGKVTRVRKKLQKPKTFNKNNNKVLLNKIFTSNEFNVDEKILLAKLLK